MAEEPFRSMKIREQGLVAFKVLFDPQGPAWIVSVIDWKLVVRPSPRGFRGLGKGLWII
jgi:hypothetical protein